MNGEQKNMNDAPAKMPGTTAVEPQSTELLSPHFDELDVAVAQPVQPLTRTEERRSLFSRSREIILQSRASIVIVLGFALILAAAAGAAFSLRAADAVVNHLASETASPSEDTRSANPPASVPEPEKSTTSAIQPERKALNDFGKTLRHSRSLNQSSKAGRKPVARKVGEIRY